MPFQPVQDGNNVPVLADARQRPIGLKLRQWLQALGNTHKNAITALGLGHNTANPPYGATITPDLSQGAIQKITVTNSSNFTIAAPINITQLATWSLIILNASGGSMGTVTFGSGINQSGFSAPGNGEQTSVSFRIEPGATPEHYQLGAWSPAL